MLPQDRYSPRIDQGERLFRFWINGGSSGERLQKIDREALAYNEKPMALSFFPHGGNQVTESFITLSDDVVQVTDGVVEAFACFLFVLVQQHNSVLQRQADRVD